MKIMVMGAGGQGAPCASILSRDADVSEIKLCDINTDLLEKVGQKINSPKVKTAKVDASNREEISGATKGMDVIIDLSPPVFFTTVMEAAYAAGVHYVNTAWEEYLYANYEKEDVKLGDKLKMYDQFADRGLTAILGCGMPSGYATNVLARYYVDRLDTVESIKMRLAKKNSAYSDEEEILHRWEPGWNPRQALLDFVTPSYKFCNGEFVKMEEVFSEPELWEFPAPIGKILVSHHAHEEPISLPFSFQKKGLQYCDFKYYVNKQIAPIVVLGLGQSGKINVKGVEISPMDVVLSFVTESQNAFLNEDPSKFAHLDATKAVSIMMEIKGTRNRREVTYLIHVPDMNAPRQKLYNAYGTSLVAVALPATVGAKMAVEGTEKGVISPQDMDPNRFLELMAKGGFEHRWEETVL